MALALVVERLTALAPPPWPARRRGVGRRGTGVGGRPVRLELGGEVG
jgi:hypothetical protein